MNTIEQEINCLVFCTNLQNKTDLKRVATALYNHPGIHSWSVDLENWEKVLRIEGVEIQAKEIISLLRSYSVEIQEMPI